MITPGDFQLSSSLYFNGENFKAEKLHIINASNSIDSSK